MDNDNVYQPRGGYLPTEPLDQVKERDEDVKKTLLAIPRLQEAVDRLDERITFYESVHSVPDESLVKPDEFMHIIAGNKVAAANLMSERDWFIGLIKEASKD